MRTVDKCSLPNRDNLMQPIHMELSQKLKSFCSFILHFPKLGEILDYFWKKNYSYSLSISEASASQKRG